MIVFTSVTGVTGLGELQSENVRLGPMLIVRDGVGMAYMRRPFTFYLCLGVDTERFDRLRGPVGIPVEISFLVSLGLSWGSGEPPTCGGASIPVPVVWY